jgi:MFS family permease
MAAFELTLEFLIAGLAGGMLGAALGALPALSLAGILIIIGEAAGSIEAVFGDGAVATVFGAEPATVDAVGLTGAVALGPVLGPHVAFAGGVAAAAFVGRKETFDTTFRYHQAKNIAKPPGSTVSTLLVGGVFGVFGVVVARVIAGVGVPVDPVFFAVVVSAFVHRLAFGYPLLGRVRNLDRSVFDMSPYEDDKRWGEESFETSQGTAGRLVVEVWLPDHYEWGQVAVLGLAVGLASGFIALVTGSPFLAFGLTLTSLLFLAAGLYTLPVTHHMALPAGISAVAFAAEFEPLVGLVVAGVFGVLGAVLGEGAQRVFYAHGDTHLDPPAVSIVLTSLLLTLLATAGVVDPATIPYPVL